MEKYKISLRSSPNHVIYIVIEKIKKREYQKRSGIQGECQSYDADRQGPGCHVSTPLGT